MAKRPLQIAIDGPISSGKSTVAREVARRLGVMLVDAGALYRTVALIALRHKIPPQRAAEAADMFAKSRVIEKMPDDGDKRTTVLLGGEDISDTIRTHEIDDLVAKFGEHKEVIDAVHEKEREMASSQGVVIEGREIGTMVLSDAQVKVYLTADAKTRAKRRLEEYLRKGDQTPESEIVRALKERDELDMRRAYAPLRKANDAVLIDTTEKTVEEVVNQILQLALREYSPIRHEG